MAHKPSICALCCDQQAPYFTPVIECEDCDSGAEATGVQQIVEISE